MSKIRCVLVDDEPPAIQLLEKYAGMVEQLEVVATFGNAMKTFDFLDTTPIDLLLLDIRMPVLNGLDFLKSLTNPPAVIITTAYREYAIEGYDLDIIDYLLKPIAFERFLKAIERYKERYGHHEKEAEHIYVNINRTHHKIILADVLYVESLKDYVRVHTLEGQHVIKGNIGTFMKLLPADQFKRIHRSYAISLLHLKSYNKSEVEVDNVKIPIGLKFRDVLSHLDGM